MICKAWFPLSDSSHVCEAISGYLVAFARNCTSDHIVMQMKNTNRVKGY